MTGDWEVPSSLRPELAHSCWMGSTSGVTSAEGPQVSTTAECWFWITFSAGATEGHQNRDHERSWLMSPSRTCGSIRSKTL
jgi:hypothetical protein